MESLSQEELIAAVYWLYAESEHLSARLEEETRRQLDELKR